MMGKCLILHADGASLGNPGLADIEVIIEDERGRAVARMSMRIGRTTNNRAEYLALIAGMEEAARLGAQKLDTDWTPSSSSGSFRADTRAGSSTAFIDGRSSLCRDSTRAPSIMSRAAITEWPMPWRIGH